MIEAVGCKIVLAMHNIDDIDPVMRSAKAAGLAIARDQEFRRREAGVDRGTVLEIGPSVSEHYASGINVGDMIAFAKYAGKIVEDQENADKKYVVINDEDVVCILRRKDG